MTGFGQAIVQKEQGAISVQLSSVNHRYCEVEVRIHQRLVALESEIKRFIRERIKRGRVTAYIELTGPGSQKGRKLRINKDLAEQYLHLIREMGRELGLADDLSTRLLIHLPGLWELDTEELPMPEAFWEDIKETLEVALGELVESRQQEGENLQKDLEERLQEVENLIEEIKEVAPKVVEEYKAKLKERIEEIGKEVEIKEERLAMEIALFAEKSSIAEEITRCESHISQFRNTLHEEVSGKKLDFLVQELHREVNTMASKARNTQIIHLVVEIKNHLENMREQLHNVE